MNINFRKMMFIRARWFPSDATPDERPPRTA
jgi:hypothetical protein